MRNKTFISSMVGIAAAVAVAGSANAAIIYDSSSMYQWGTVSPIATSGWNGNIVQHPTQPYLAQQVAVRAPLEEGPIRIKAEAQRHHRRQRQHRPRKRSIQSRQRGVQVRTHGHDPAPRQSVVAMRHTSR